jgi:hypothetical protein
MIEAPPKISAEQLAEVKAENHRRILARQGGKAGKRGKAARGRPVK